MQIEATRRTRGAISRMNAISWWSPSACYAVAASHKQGVDLFAVDRDQVDEERETSILRPLVVRSGPRSRASRSTTYACSSLGRRAWASTSQGPAMSRTCAPGNAITGTRRCRLADDEPRGVLLIAAACVSLALMKGSVFKGYAL